MGSCTVFDRSLREIGQENEFLADSNLKILKFLPLYFIEKKQSGMAVKIINIKLISEKYYCAVAAEREKMFRKKHSFDSTQYFQLEQRVHTENTDLKRANDTLNDIYSSLASSALSFTPSVDKKLCEYSKNAEIMYRYDELQSRCIEYSQKGPGISSLALRINNGVELSKEMENILGRISKVTSHIANNPKRRINYSLDCEMSSKRSERIISLKFSHTSSTIATNGKRELRTDYSSEDCFP